MPPKKKGAKKGAKGKQDEDEFQEFESQPVQEEQVQPVIENKPPVQQQIPPIQQQMPATAVAQQVLPPKPQFQQQPPTMPVVQVVQQQIIQNQSKVLNVASDEVQNQQGSSHHEVKIDETNLTEQQKKQLRKERFFKLQDTNINTFDALQKVEEEKKKRIERALKFGVPSEEIEQQKRLERAKKFGVPSEEIEELKRQERAQKFGLNTSTTAPVQHRQVEDNDKKNQRAMRFGNKPQSETNQEVDIVKNLDPLEEEKRKKRQERFATTASAENIQGNRVIKRVKY